MKLTTLRKRWENAVNGCDHKVQAILKLVSETPVDHWSGDSFKDAQEIERFINWQWPKGRMIFKGPKVKVKQPTEFRFNAEL